MQMAKLKMRTDIDSAQMNYFTHICSNLIQNSMNS